MNPIEQLQEAFAHFLGQQFGHENLPKTNLLTINTDENKQDFGDLNSSIALALAKPLAKKPLEIAQAIAANFTNTSVDKIAIAGPGFLNFTLTPETFERLTTLLTDQKDIFFTLPTNHPRKTISLEFVSANPTGPLHLGHGRGGIIGDVLGNILKFIGHSVTKEFYINDAGSQIAKLGKSFKIRCQQALGIETELPEDGYHGDYLVDLAQKCVQSHKSDLLNESDEFFARFAKEHMLKQIEHTLTAYGINFDVWFSEKTLHDSGQIDAIIRELQETNYLYEKDGALWFRSTDFGDDKDRVVRKASGELTYVAADMAYLKNKIARGFDELIIVLGQDHHSYAVRLQGALKALKLNAHPLFIILYQLVSLKKGDQQIRMSKRAGTMISLTEIIETVGCDSARFFYLNRKVDAHLEFDLELALKQTDENPVYYLQYAYARTKSILEKAQLIADFAPLMENIKMNVQLFDQEDRFLIKKIIALKQLLNDIASHHQTHLLAYYAHELAQIFNRYYHTHKVIDEKAVDVSIHRLALVAITKETLTTIFKLLGISRPERM